MNVRVPVSTAMLLLGMCAPLFSSAQVVDAPAIAALTARSLYTDTSYIAALADIEVSLESTQVVSVENVSVSVNGEAVTMTASTTGTHFTGIHRVEVGDTEGPIDLRASIAGGAEQVGVTEGDTLIIDLTPPSLSLTQLSPISFEATQPEGSPVAYLMPESSDPLVEVVCEPSSGANFIVGDTEVFCFALDLAGNTSDSVTFFTVQVSDTTAPMVELVGDAELSIEQDSIYMDPGLTISDNAYTEFTTTTDIAVDTSVPDTYTITYTVTDGSGNSATIARTVTVVATSSGGGGRSSQDDEEEEVAAEPGEVLGESDETAQGEVLGARAYHFTSYLRMGATGEEVIELQKLLSAFGHLSHEPTGYFGPLTRAALAAYQEAHGLQPVGYIGPKTLALLNMGTVSSDPRIPALLEEIMRLQAEINKLKGVQ
ncbi:MAG TPA: peptidoglycan-binding protein [Candidatus Paceibacterota bacterium]|nr:peptidoglycan-binding protein [Candidatus Paceibacterota bacterium]